MNPPVNTTSLERRLLWVGRREKQLTELVQPLEPYPIALRAKDGCQDALTLMAYWPPHLLILDTPTGPTPPFTWDTFLGEELPAVDPYRPGGLWYQEDDTPRVLPVLFLTNDIPGPADLPLAWRYRIHCQPRYHITHFLQAWLEKPLNPPRLAPEPLLIIDFVRSAIWVQGKTLRLPPRTMEVLAVLTEHHPQPLMGADIAQHLHERTGRRTPGHGVRAAVQALRFRLKTLGLDLDLLDNCGGGYSLSLGCPTGSLKDRVWFWSDVDAWWSPDTSRLSGRLLLD